MRTRLLTFALCACAATVSAATADRHAALLPAAEGWTLSPDVRHFEPDRLYQHVNGASELFLGYGFLELVVADYTNGRGGTVTVEVYRHASAADAFGIYSQERPAQGRYLTIGAESYLEPPVLNLLAGSAYVKLAADGLGGETEATLRLFAESASARLGADRLLPAALALFPADGKAPHSERYAAKDFLGYEFLRSGFTADYVVDGTRFQLFVMESATPEETARKLRLYRERAGASREAPAAATEVLADPYNGEVALVRRGRLACGVLGLRDPTLRERYLAALRRALPEGD